MIVPCRDEESRLEPAQFNRYLEGIQGRYFLFVDDGSRDGTAAILEGICRTFPGRTRWIRLEKSEGKAVAVRAGMNLALEWREFSCIGYMDADLSTPLWEIDRFLSILFHNTESMMLMGSRLHPDASEIKKHGIAGLGTRIFSGVVSVYMGRRFYDTQCGFKIFRKEAARNCFADPFKSRWIFDVEVLVRMHHTVSASEDPSAIIEVPLNGWRGRKGSRISLWKKFLSVLYLPFLLIRIKD